MCQKDSLRPQLPALGKALASVS
ncbi:hypothetical protein CO2235_100090 [Cupriavidus oxalaticus]|uniref:Uncharacterized protein n=1 Tax=Cupriavidus oxalaticus TaxID=96344 RepID=A0A976B9R9_9BURK|nr:hypothetical protein CO2235_100090 [Cupriavidus oxalaticus]